MPYPAEYQRATDDFESFMCAVRDEADFGSSHQAYTMTQGVFQTFRRRLSTKDAIRFANILPAGIRSLFLADWEPGEQQLPFSELEKMNAEVALLRPEHNFSRKNAIQIVAKVLSSQVDCQRLKEALSLLPPEAASFWASPK